jgi:hypothetical protein
MRVGLYLLIIAIAISCGSSIPKDVLPPDKMKSVLWDIMQADELADYNMVKDSTFSRLEKRVEYYQDALSVHKITKDQFTKSLSYYSTHPEDFKTVLDSLQSFGERMQNSPVADTSIQQHNNLKRRDSPSKKLPALQQE